MVEARQDVQPKRQLFVRSHVPAPRSSLTLALTGTAPAGVIKGGQAVEDDVGLMDHLQGCVRGRMLRLGKMAPLFPETRGAIGMAIDAPNILFV